MILVANWKMNMTRARIEEYLSVLEKGRIGDHLDPKGFSAAIAPSHVYLDYLSKEVARRKLQVEVFAQDVSTRTQGAFTGEVGAPNLRDVGASGSIVGHSERRRYFRETDEEVAVKTRVCLESGLVPVVCVGETEAERRSGAMREVLLRQLVPVAEVLAVARKNGNGTPFYVAYEPVWAIGTGANASIEEIGEVFSFLSEAVTWPDRPRFLYGGSVNVGNVPELSTLPGLAGFLVGTAWLDPNAFLESARIAGSASLAKMPPRR